MKNSAKYGPPTGAKLGKGASEGTPGIQLKGSNFEENETGHAVNKAKNMGGAEGSGKGAILASGAPGNIPAGAR